MRAPTHRAGLEAVAGAGGSSLEDSLDPPYKRQMDAYRRWFKDVPHGFDNPWAPGS
ncbi:MAG TPA: hypothetical protein VGJ05_14565 [Fimbriiglobus sp.]